MADKAWKVHLSHLIWGKIHVWGVHLKYRPSSIGRSQLILRLDLNNHTWELTISGRRKAPWLTKPGKPSSAG